jgi:hypothetical protein
MHAALQLRTTRVTRQILASHHGIDDDPLASVRRRQRADDASRAVCWSKAASTTAGSHQRVQSPLAQKQPQPPEHEILSPLHEQSAMCDSFAWFPWQAARMPA